METDETRQNTEPQEGTDTGEENNEQENNGQQESTEGNSTEKPSWNDWLASLPEDQQSMVRGELERKEKDLRKARNEARNLRTRAQEAEAKAAEEGRTAEDKSTAESRANEANSTLRNENQGLRQRLVTQEIKVQAASKFADPDDPAELLASQITDLMDDSLEPDAQAISDALAELLERKPHLAKQESKPRVPAPNKAQGSSGTTTSSPGSKGLAEAQRRYGDRARAKAS